jgi:hypothetical protein
MTYRKHTGKKRPVGTHAEDHGGGEGTGCERRRWCEKKRSDFGREFQRPEVRRRRTAA